MSTGAPRLQHSNVSIDGLTLIELPEAVVEPPARLLKDLFILGDEVLNARVGNDWLIESNTILCVLNSIVLSSLCKTETLSYNEAALELKVLHEEQPAFTSTTNALIFGYYYIIEEYVYERYGVLTKLGQVSSRNTFGFALNKPQRHVAVFTSRILVLADYQQIRYVSTIGNPSLLTIEYVSTVSLLLRGHGHALVVRTSSWLGKAECCNGLTRLFIFFHDDRGLFRSAELSKVSASEHTGHERSHSAGELIKLLGHKTQGYVVSWNTANFFWKAHEWETSVTISILSFCGNLMVFVHLPYRLIVEIAISIFLEGFNKELLLVGKTKIHNLLLLLVFIEKTNVVLAAQNARKRTF